jgi:sensor histidine kinase regulating citrate/malate metabolism
MMQTLYAPSGKGQMKIQQMVLMLLAVTLFFVMIGLVMLAFVFSGVREGAQIQEENNAILLATKLANSPEFSCGGAYGTIK